ncbi:MAG: orotidine 5'-phosphate decarboxylase [Candidatus Riflebacteria bacterium RBG_13_59_9]|nr:MAG: orotidine 5'-phosphate decarboxylase [Candidatus Riflebacteria bacterium RBG_13_59_9]
MSAVGAKRTLLLLGMDPDFPRIQQDFAGQRVELDPVARRILESAPLAGLAEIPALPDGFRENYERLVFFAAQTIYALREEVLGVKFQIAYFEEVGPLGLHALAALIALCRELDLLVIVDAKRGDIGSTFERYLNAYLTDTGNPLSMEADAMTVNPLVGTDTWNLFVPYLKRGKGVILLTYPTAPGAVTIMESTVGDEPLWRVLARTARRMVIEHALEREPANLALVVGALRPPMAERIREVFPEAIFLVPGIGTQGGTMANAAAFTGGKNWAMFNVSRGILYAYAKTEAMPGERGAEFWKASLREAQDFNTELRSVLRFS